MSIEVVEIDDNQFDEILKFEESHFLDLKSIEIKPAKLTKSISGFANADGGELYIGISENNIEAQKKRSWEGFID
ncbi:MAG: RNA-binding domain-containing protein [Rivularia sp. (in: cyanobacteria)]